MTVPKNRYDDEELYDARAPQVVSSRVLGEDEILVHPGSNTTVMV